MANTQKALRCLLFLMGGVVVPLSAGWLDFQFTHGHNISIIWLVSLILAAVTIMRLPLSTANRWGVFVFWVPLYGGALFVFGMHFLHGTSG